MTSHYHGLNTASNHTHDFATDDTWKQSFAPITISEETARNFLARDQREAEMSMSKMIDDVMRKHYLPKLNEQLYKPSGISDLIRGNLTQEKNMDTKYLVDDEVARRKAKKAKAKVRKAYKAFDALELDGADYKVWAWAHIFKGNDTQYEYVAVYVNERWYVTGAKSPNGLDTDEFVGWLIGMEFNPESFVELA